MSFGALKDPIAEADKQSVVVHPKDPNDRRITIRGFQSRGPILAEWGSRLRLADQFTFYHHDYSGMFRSVIVGLASRIQSTPWEIKSTQDDGDQWQGLLMNADFGDWDRFIGKLVADYSRYDQGAFIELIGAGNPKGELKGPVQNMAILDSRRCYPTASLEWPVIYYDINNKLHLMHRTRVVQFVDMEDPSEDLPGIGDCALSRCIAPIQREILMGRYVEQMLDDNPPPGITVFGNISETEVEAAFVKMEEERRTDSRGEWGKMLRIYGLNTNEKPTLTSFAFSQMPEKFDFEKITNLDAKLMAAGIGVDIQEFWELSAGGLGTGTQSEVLAQKSRGKAYGLIMKRLERTINRALPEDVEFSFQYKDPQEDIEEANKAATWVSTAQIVANDLSQDERRRLLANQIPAMRDVLTDEEGVVIRLPDDDLKPEGSQPVQVPEQESITTDDQMADDQKDFEDTSSDFAKLFTTAIKQARDGDVSKAAVRSILRDALRDSGTQAFDDGLEEEGVSPDDLDAEAKADKRRAVAEWVSAQSSFISKFADTALELDDSQIATRAELWVSKSLRIMLFAGKAAAAPNQLQKWKLGPTKEHCDTCLTMNGQVHKMKDYVKKGIMPGASTLDCKGYECKCFFEKVRGKRPAGRFPSPGRLDKLLRVGKRILGRLGL